MHRAGQCAGDIFSEEMGGGDLTPRQYAVLVSVAENEGLSQTDLVARTGIDRSTLADIIRRLLRKGLLQRRRTRRDARTYAVRLTTAGWDALRASEAAVASADRRLLAALPKSKRSAFLASLSKIVETLDRPSAT